MTNKKKPKSKTCGLIRITANVEKDIADWLDDGAEKLRLPQASFLRMKLAEMKDMEEKKQ